MIALVIADDQTLLREGVRRIVAEHADIEVVGEATSADALLALLGTTQANVLLLDVNLPGPGVRRLMLDLRQRRRRPRVLALSGNPDRRHALAVLRAGAAGYLTTYHSGARLIEAIRLVAAGRRVHLESPERFEGSRARDWPEGLSDREREVLRLLSGGQTGREVAQQLGLSPKTVSTYRTRIMEKLRLHSTADLVRYALEKGLGED